MKNVFTARTTGFYLGLLACLAALAGALWLLFTDAGDITFSWITIGLMAAGIVFEIVNCLTDWVAAQLLSALFWGCGLSWHLYIGLPTLSDIWNGVHFIGGNAQAVLVGGACFAVATVLSIASCFMDQRKTILLV